MTGTEELVEKGNTSLRQGRHEEARRHYEQALALAPGHPGILNNYAAVLEKLDQLDEALAAYAQVQAQIPPHAGVLTNWSVVLMKLHRLDEALAKIEQAIRLAPHYAEAFNCRGSILFGLGRRQEALESYDRATALRPGHSTSLLNRAAVLQELKRFKDADLALTELLQREPTFPRVRQLVLNNRLRGCDWTDYAALAADVVQRVEGGEVSVDPFYFLGIADRASSQLAAARTFGAQYGPMAPEVLPSTGRGGRIHVAYVCADLGIMRSGILRGDCSRATIERASRFQGSRWVRCGPGCLSISTN